MALAGSTCPQKVPLCVELDSMTLFLNKDLQGFTGNLRGSLLARLV